MTDDAEKVRAYPTSIRFSDEHLAGLRRIRNKTKVPMATLVKLSVDAFLAGAPSKDEGLAEYVANADEWAEELREIVRDGEGNPLGKG